MSLCVIFKSWHLCRLLWWCVPRKYDFQGLIKMKIYLKKNPAIAETIDATTNQITNLSWHEAFENSSQENVSIKWIVKLRHALDKSSSSLTFGQAIRCRGTGTGAQQSANLWQVSILATFKKTTDDHNESTAGADALEFEASYNVASPLKRSLVGVSEARPSLVYVYTRIPASSSTQNGECGQPHAVRGAVTLASPSLDPRPCFLYFNARSKTGPGIHCMGDSAHVPPIPQNLGNSFTLVKPL